MVLGTNLLTRSTPRRKSNLSKNLGLFASPSDVGWTAFSQKEIIERIESFSTEILIPLAAITNALGCGGQENPRYLRYLANIFLGEPIARGLANDPRWRERFHWICPWHFRILEALVIAYGRRNGGLFLRDRSAQLLFGKLLLSIGSAFRVDVYDNVGGAEGQWLTTALQLQHNAYLVESKWRTMLSLKEQIISEFLEKRGLDEEITANLGFSARELYMGLFGLWARFTRNSPEYLSATGSNLVNLEYYFGAMRLGRNVGDFILNQYAADLEEAAPLSSSKGPVLKGIVDRPLFHTRRQLVGSYDVELLLQRATRCVWNLKKSLPASALTKNFNAEAGQVYEQFCRRVVKNIVQQRKSVGSNAFLVDEGAIARAPVDDLLIEGKTAIAFEYKSGLLPMDAVYGRSPADLKRAIDEKFVEGSEGSPLSFRQLQKHLSTMRTKPATFGLERVSSIRPCLVVEERLLTQVPCNSYIVTRAATMFRHLPGVAAPVVIHVDDLFGILERSRVASPSEILSRIASVDLRSHLLIENVIVRTWPHESLEAQESLVEVQRETPLMDWIEAQLSGNPNTPVGPGCAKCGSETTLIFLEGDTPALWCSECNAVSSTDVDPGLVQRHHEHVEEAVQWYREH